LFLERNPFKDIEDDEIEPMRVSNTTEKVKKKKDKKSKSIVFKKRTLLISDTSSMKSMKSIKFKGIQEERGEMSKKIVRALIPEGIKV